MSPSALRSFLEALPRNERRAVRAIVPVHLYGLPAPIVELKEIAAEFNLKLVEDACQAHGARVRTADGIKMAGTFGDAGCFSFYPGKNLGAWGDGGAVATNDDELAHRISSFSNHGRLSHYAHEICGYNSRLDSIQAAVLRAKLEKLAEWNERRRVVAAAYRELLAPLDAQPILEPQGSESCYHLFVIRSARRDAVRNALLQADIECGIHYPVPLHLQPALAYLGYRAGDFPASEALADTTLSLPMHPHLDGQEILRTVETVTSVLAPANEAAAPRRNASPAIGSASSDA
jgi:dTDP-4-amino-4,6-dideoxygalactose transaminase